LRVPANRWSSEDNPFGHPAGTSERKRPDTFVFCRDVQADKVSLEDKGFGPPL
jgi:hypothetical protein